VDEIHGNTLLVTLLCSFISTILNTIKRENYATCIGICLKLSLLKNDRNFTLGIIQNCSRGNQGWYPYY
jgi:hypothetical protein